MYTGLSSKEAAERLVTYGKNALPSPRYRFLRLLARQFAGIFNMLLLAAAVVTWFLGEPIDASFILVFVGLSVGLNLYQEHKSNAAADTLRSMLVRTMTVRRDNQDRLIPIEELVPGDILKLKTGDILPADAHVRHTTALQVDETTFTGESLPVTKVAEGEGDVGTDASLLMQGVVIVRGNAFAEVVATGAETRLAHIAATVSATESESKLNISIDRISRFILKMTVLTLVCVVVANVLIEGEGANIPELIVFAIALAVSVIPEALPLVMTFSLSHGALILAKKGVIVKRLSSVQDLGSVELLCSDKTGTITENHLTLVNTHSTAGTNFSPLLLARLRTSIEVTSCLPAESRE